MDFERAWPTHKQGEATRQQILNALDKPRTKAELSNLCNKSIRQIERHLQTLSIQGHITSNAQGQIVRRLAAGFVLIIAGFFTP